MILLKNGEVRQGMLAIAQGLNVCCVAPLTRSSTAIAILITLPAWFLSAIACMRTSFWIPALVYRVIWHMDGADVSMLSRNMSSTLSLHLYDQRWNTEKANHTLHCIVGQVSHGSIPSNDVTVATHLESWSAQLHPKCLC